MELTLLPGCAATGLPAPVQLTLPDKGGQFLFQATPVGADKVQIVGRLQLYKTHYPAQEYHALREFYTQALARLAVAIVCQQK